MKYMGSKARIAKHLLPIILKDRSPDQWYVEPFVGGANMIDKVDGLRIGADSNAAVIEALKFIRDCDTPKNNMEYGEQDYANDCAAARDDRELLGLQSYALIAFSFGAKWLGGWSRGKSSSGKQRDYVAEQHRASEKQKAKLQGLILECSWYSSLAIPDNSIIYCDPPYAGTTKYKDAFDHADFWRWCREKTKEGHRVFISEYNAPGDFKCIWSQELNVSVAKEGEHKKATERLFIHNTQI
jgi:DNA adenine methylase